MSRKVKNTIPVYDIDTINGTKQSNADIIVERLEPYLGVHPNLHAAHKHDFYHVVLFTAGSGTHTIDFERFPVKKGQVYFMIPGQVHSWSFKGKVDGYIINFSSALLQLLLCDRQYPERFSFFKGSAKDSVVQLSAPVMDKAIALMDMLILEVDGQRAFSKDMIAGLLIQLFVTVDRETTVSHISAQPQQNQLLLFNFRKLVEEYYTTMHLPKEYAGMLYITPNYLNGICKDVLGKSAGQVIRERILLEAKRLLVNAGINIEAIAAQLNFLDNSYFTKFFKKYTGMTPEAFRKESLNNFN